MKKFTFLVTDNEYEGFIEAIRDLGVVHVTQLQQGATSPELQEAVSLEQRYRAVLDFMDVIDKLYVLNSATPASEALSPEEMLQRVEALRSKENALLHEEDELERELSVLEPWGDFDPELLDRLSASAGMEIHF
ncbi:MAG: V-type ATP synthase subunit I, partial [Bacteroidaceae bacterium]|nr:V-type ATP synthase subunit I [Bacteroidaceae bacterium]